MPHHTHRPPTPNGPGHCPRCLTKVIWCITTANRVPQAINAHRNTDGNQAVRTDHTGRWIVRQLTHERPTPEAGENLHLPHIATCTNPPRHPHTTRNTR